MRTVSYEVFEGDGTVTVIPGGSSSAIQQVSTRAANDRPRYVRTYPIFSDGFPSPSPNNHYRPHLERQYIDRSISRPGERREEKMVEIVRRSSSPERKLDEVPRSILRTTTTATAIDTTAATVASATSSSTVTTASVKPSDPPPTTAFNSRGRTSSRTGTFYFAYGINVSPMQMRAHSFHSSSSRPIAVAKLHNYTWYINKRGVANIAPCARTEKRDTESDSDIVWGLLYEILAEDERDIDEHQGFNPIDVQGPNPDLDQTHFRPWIQGPQCNSNKLYLLTEISEWLVPDPREFGLREAIHDGDSVRSLVYIDEVNVIPGRIRNEFLDRMCDAAGAAVSYGIPPGWVRNVMKMYGIRPRRQDIGRLLVDDDHDDDRIATERVTDTTMVHVKRLSSDLRG